LFVLGSDDLEPFLGSFGVAAPSQTNHDVFQRNVVAVGVGDCGVCEPAGFQGGLGVVQKALFEQSRNDGTAPSELSGLV